MDRDRETSTREISASPPPRISDSDPSAPRFSTQIAWTFGVRLLMTVNSVVAGVIVARWLGAEGLGQLAVINVSVATIVQLASIGLPSANTYFIAQDSRHLAAAAINSLLFSLIVGCLLALGLTGLAVWRPDWFGSISPRLIGVAAVSIPFQLLTLIGLNIFLALGRIRRFNLLDLAGQVFVLINALVVLVILKAGLSALVSLNTATSVLIGVLIVVLVATHGTTLKDKRRWRPDLALLRRMMSYGIKFHISILAGALIFRADLLVVNHFRGSSEAGVYSVASQVAMMLMLLPGVIATLLFPRVTAEQDVRGETTCLVSRHTAFVMLVCCLAAIPFSYLLPLLYGRAFSDVPWQILILLPGVYLIGIESVLVQHLNAIGLPRAIPLFWLVTLLINIILVFALVPRFGARGAALASTISYALIFILIARQFRASTGRPLADALLMRGGEFRRLLVPRDFRQSRGTL
ncbi:MAG: flippase [bacterium]